MRVLLIILALLVLLAFLRIKVSLCFGEQLHAWLFVGPFKTELFKKRDKGPKAAKVKKEKKPRPKPSFDEVIELLKTLLKALKSALRRLKRSVHIDPLTVSLRIADKDPAKTAQLYGYANAAMWTLMPLAEDAFDIPHPAIHLEMDFERERFAWEGELGVSLRVFDILAIVLVLLVPLVKWYCRFLRAHKNDPPPKRKKAETKREEPSEKTV